MDEQKKRPIRLIKAPWLSLRRRIGRKSGGLRLSRRRKRWGSVLLGVMAAVVGAYLYLSNPSNVRASAESYLNKLVSGDVEISRATFSFTKGIKLRGILILTDEAEAGGQPIFKAESVDLKLSWMALVQGRLAATKISAFRPEVFLVEGVDGHWNFESLFVQRDLNVVRPLPKIILQEGKVHYYEDVGGKAVLGGTFALGARFDPTGPNSNDYIGQVETSMAGQTVAQIEGQFDTVSGTFSKIAAQISLTQAMSQSLPRRARRWMDKYDIRGELAVSGHYGQDGQTQIRAELRGISLRLPLDERTSVEVTNARGQLEFKDEAIVLGDQLGEQTTHQPLHLTALGADWDIGGQILGYQSRAGFDLDISCDELELPKDPELIANLPKMVRKIIKDWNPTGRISLKGKLARAGGSEPKIQANGEVRFIDVTGTFRHFPYATQNISGLVRFNDQKAVLENFRARHQSPSDASKFAELRANGEILAPYDKARVNVMVTTEELFLDDDLREALAPDKKAQWDMFEPTGTAKVRCRVVHKPGLNVSWIGYIEAELTGVSVKAKEFPYPLSDLHGRVCIGPDSVEVGWPTRQSSEPSNEPANERNFVKGRGGKATVELRGVVERLGKPDELMNLEIKAEGMEFNEVLVAALHPDARELYETLNPSGSADIRANIIRSKDKNEESGFLIDVWPRDAQCRHKDFPYPLEQVTGHVRLSPGKFELVEFKAKQGQASFKGSGVIVTKDKEHYQADLTIWGKGVELDKLVYESLKPDQKQTWDDLEPAGKCDAKLRVIDDPGGLLSYEVTVEPLGGQMTYKLFPYTLRDLSGDVVIEPKQVQVNIRGNEPTIKVTGYVKQIKDKQSAKLVVVAEQVVMDEKLKTVLPKNVQELWEIFDPQGKVDVQIDSLNYIPGTTGSDDGRLGMKGTLVLKELVLNKPLVCRDLTGSIAGSMQSGDKGLELVLQGELSAPKLNVASVELEKVSGIFIKGSKQSDQWSIHNIRASLAGGQVVGHLKSGRGTKGGYSALLQAQNVDLAKLIQQIKRAKGTVPDKDAQNSGQVTGILKGSVSMEGQFDDPTSMAGRGRILIDHARLYKQPVMTEIMRDLNLQPVNANAFDKVEVEFYLQGQQIIFTQIMLSGPALRMGGMGIYQRDKDWLAVILKRDPPDDIWIQLPALPEAMVAEINGPLADPKVEAKPFRDVSEELKSLFRKRKPRK